MTESFEHQVKTYRLWNWLYNELLTKEQVQQNDIIEYCEKNKIGSKKSILSILNDFLKTQLIQEIELSDNSVGRPKKAYRKYREKDVDLTLLNLADFPPIVKEFIRDESVKGKILPTEVVIKLVLWAYNFLSSMQYTDNPPMDNLPDHLKIPSDPLFRLIDK